MSKFAAALNARHAEPAPTPTPQSLKLVDLEATEHQTTGPY